MDITREPSKKPLLTAKTVVLVIVSVAVVILAYLSSSLGTKSYSRSSLMIAEVQQGAMQVKVYGNGTLVPSEVLWVATNVPARVERILVKPGSYVEKGQLLVKLDNPELIQAAEDVLWEVEASRAELAALNVSLQSDILNQRSLIKTVDINLETAQLTYNAEATLIERGSGGISKLNHKESELEVKKITNSLQVEKERLVQIEKNRDAQINASEARLKKLMNNLARAEHNRDSLNVIAEQSGVIQEVPIEPGQRLSTGANLLKMADQSNLIAELKVAERMINDVAVGQQVLIDTSKSEVQGTVTRIDPAVINGSVLVEVEFTEDLPKEARPDLRVRGDILIADIEDTLYVKRPALAQSDQQSIIYVLDSSESYAHKTPVSYGQGSSDQIQIISGLQPRSKIILSDHTSWEHLKKIKIN